MEQLIIAAYESLPIFLFIISAVCTLFFLVYPMYSGLDKNQWRYFLGALPCASFLYLALTFFDMFDKGYEDILAQFLISANEVLFQFLSIIFILLTLLCFIIGGGKSKDNKYYLLLLLPGVLFLYLTIIFTYMYAII